MFGVWDVILQQLCKHPSNKPNLTRVGHILDEAKHSLRQFRRWVVQHRGKRGNKVIRCLAKYINM